MLGIIKQPEASSDKLLQTFLHGVDRTVAVTVERHLFAQIGKRQNGMRSFFLLRVRPVIHITADEPKRRLAARNS